MKKLKAMYNISIIKIEVYDFILTQYFLIFIMVYKNHKFSKIFGSII